MALVGVPDRGTVRVPDEDAAYEWAFEHGWSDGLPVVPPTPARVERMLAGIRRSPSDLVGLVPPKMGRATIEKVAINAVMAGARPEYLPVIVAALEALLEEPFNLNGVNATTHNSAPLVVVNGPIARELDVNSGHNCFGPGWRANATIGRAIRLILQNLGGAVPGEQDKSTQGHPGKYTYCIAENEGASPWPPFHVERGFQPDDDVVTVFACEAPHSIGDHISTGPRGVLTTVASTMTTMGNNNTYVQGQLMVVFCPEHAQTVARAGWSKTDVKRWLFEHARQRVGTIKRGGSYTPEFVESFWPKWVDADDDDAMIPLVHEPEHILVLVAGGAGRMSSFLPGWGDLGSRAVSRKIVR